MDFLKSHDARSAAETPIEVELRDPATGEVIMDGAKPCIVLVKGAASRSVQESLRQDALERARKAKAAKAEKGEDDTRVIADLHADSIRAAARLVVGFVNMRTSDEKGEMRDLTVADVAAVMDLNLFSLAHAMRDPDDAAWRKPSFAQQVLDAASDDARFLSRSNPA